MRTLAHPGMGLLIPAVAVILKVEICAENQHDHKTKLNNIAHQNVSEAERQSPCHRAAMLVGHTQMLAANFNCEEVRKKASCRHGNTQCTVTRVV